MERKWVKIVSVNSEAIATMAKNLLELEGIEVVLVNKTDSAYVHLGEVEIMVPHNQAVVATRIIQEIN